MNRLTGLSTLAFPSRARWGKMEMFTRPGFDPDDSPVVISETPGGPGRVNNDSGSSRRGLFMTPMPLSELPEWKQEEIRQAVEQPKPPPKWLYFGPSDSLRPLAAIISRAWYEWHLARGRRFDGEVFPRPGIPKNLRLEIIARDGFVCRLCGGFSAPNDVDIDHVLPVSRGGKTEHGNLQVTHASCNRRKGNRTEAEA